MAIATGTVETKKRGSMWKTILGIAPPYLQNISGQMLEYSSSSSAARFNELMAEHDEWEYGYVLNRQLKALKEATNQDVGTAIANAGASGFTLDSPSAQTAIDAIVRAGHMDAAIILAKGDIGTWKAKSEQRYYARERRGAAVGAGIGIAGSLLSAYGKYKDVTAPAPEKKEE